MTADARSYRDIRANMELTPVCTGLDHCADRRHGRREKRCQWSRVPAGRSRG
jgi:hypothetical protein